METTVETTVRTKGTGIVLAVWVIGCLTAIIILLSMARQRYHLKYEMDYSPPSYHAELQYPVPSASDQAP